METFIENALGDESCDHLRFLRTLQGQSHNNSPNDCVHSICWSKSTDDKPQRNMGKVGKCRNTPHHLTIVRLHVLICDMVKSFIRPIDSQILRLPMDRCDTFDSDERVVENQTKFQPSTSTLSCVQTVNRRQKLAEKSTTTDTVNRRQKLAEKSTTAHVHCPKLSQSVDHCQKTKKPLIGTVIIDHGQQIIANSIMGTDIKSSSETGGGVHYCPCTHCYELKKAWIIVREQRNR
ncbi:hypothetical protein J6590_042442 [Homalodisca vitripennis]|nr:hypothetical protein J6590_042442 [Homalodisca vitripennis]